MLSILLDTAMQQQICHIKHQAAKYRSAQGMGFVESVHWPSMLVSKFDGYARLRSMNSLVLSDCHEPCFHKTMSMQFALLFCVLPFG